jgi:hypothetical protein
MALPKFHRGWYVTCLSNGIKGKVEDVINTPRGFEYTVVASGSFGTRITFHESQLVREGDQSGQNYKKRY